ncbi:T9SS type A sorting domain-containing protein [candidate division WOR-3 bacterium]|nr:T9SS type A sorting domain-containing protein [candidate division WOR-3 bacterium]
MKIIAPLLIPIIIFAVEVNIPTADYSFDNGLLCMDGFGHTPGFTLPVRVFPIIIPPTIEIYQIEVSGFPSTILEFSPNLTQYAIQRAPLESLKIDSSFNRNMAVVLPSMIFNDNVIHPVIIYPFFYNENDELTHTPVININIGLNIDNLSLPSYPFGRNEDNKHLCILTIPSIESILENFISRKVSLGYKVSVLIVPPLVDAIEIRKLIKERYIEWGFSHLLIIGNYESIPQFQYREVNTDFFYGELTSDMQDRLEPFAEVAVGRIPYTEPQAVECLLSNSILFQIRDEKKDIFFSITEDMVSPEFIKDMYSLFSPYNVDCDIPGGEYSVYIEHTLNVRLDIPLENAIIISTTAHSADLLLKKYGNRAACIIAPTSDSYLMPRNPGGTSTYLYNILKNLLLEDMSIGEAIRLGAIDYWMEYPDSFTEKNIASFHIFGDPTNTFKIAQLEDVGLKDVLCIPFRVEPGKSLSPTVIVKNFGDKTAYNGKVIVEIKKDGDILYSEIVDILDIKPMDEREIDFPEFVMCEGTLHIIISTIFPGDFNASNDIVEKTILSGFDVPIVISTDTLYANLFMESLSQEAFFSTDTSYRGELRNVFFLEPFQAVGENIYIEGFIPDKDYSGRIDGIGRFAGYSFEYNGPLSSGLPDWLNYDSLSIAMVDTDGNPVAFNQGSYFIFLGRALYLNQPALFLSIIRADFDIKTGTLKDTLTTLFECNPNPTRGETAILFEIPLDDIQVTLSIYDITGHLVKKLVDKKFSMGIYSYIFDGLDSAGRELVTGTYFISLSLEGITFTRKLIKLR